MKKIENGENAEFPTSDEELKEQYKEIVDPLKSEKMLYLADHVLSAHVIKTLKALESKNEFAVKSEMLQINEQTYKQANELVATEEELRTMIVVDEVAEIYPNNNNIILDDNEEEVLQKENVNNLI